MKKIGIVLMKAGETVNIGKHEAGDKVFVCEKQASLLIKRGDAKKVKTVKPKEEKVDGRK